MWVMWEIVIVNLSFMWDILYEGGEALAVLPRELWCPIPGGAQSQVRWVLGSLSWWGAFSQAVPNMSPATASFSPLQYPCPNLVIPFIPVAHLWFACNTLLGACHDALLCWSGIATGMGSSYLSFTMLCVEQSTITSPFFITWNQQPVSCQASTPPWMSGSNFWELCKVPLETPI